MEPQVVAPFVAVVAAFVGGMVVEDKFFVVMRVKDFIADVKARFSKVKDAASGK
jgi:hypothetical protein